VSLNNRIYFRDYAARHGTLEVHVDCSRHVEGDQPHRPTISSLRFNQIGSPTNTGVGDTFKLNTISHIVSLEKSTGEGDGIDIPPDGRR